MWDLSSLTFSNPYSRAIVSMTFLYSSSVFTWMNPKSFVDRYFVSFSMISTCSSSRILVLILLNSSSVLTGQNILVSSVLTDNDLAGLFVVISSTMNSEFFLFCTFDCCGADFLVLDFV